MIKLLPLSAIAFIGSGLNRPECVLSHKSGLLFVPDWTNQGGICVIHPDGFCQRILHRHNDFSIRANGIALEADNSCLLAHLGDEDGGIYRLTSDGSLAPYVMTANGKPLPPTNYVVRDRQHRLWITVSTRITPRADDYRSSANTGFIAMAEPGQKDATIVADNLGYTNECVIDESAGLLYVNETFARRLTQFRLHSDGRLSDKHTIMTFAEGCYPDGLALASDGSLWITNIVSNRIIVVSKEHIAHTFLEDSDAHHLALTEAAYQQDKLGRTHLDKACSAKLKNISNLAFGGKDLRHAYLGNLLGDAIPFFDSPVAGIPLPHWEAPIDGWTLARRTI